MREQLLVRTKNHPNFYFHEIETIYHLSFWSFSRIKCKALKSSTLNKISARKSTSEFPSLPVAWHWNSSPRRFFTLRPPCWCPSTKLYKFRINISPNKARMKNRTVLNLSEAVSILIIYHIPDSWLHLLNDCEFCFRWRDGENQQ